MKTTHRIGRILIIALILSAYAPITRANDAATTNLLTNGGFEGGMDPWRDFGTGATLETTDVAEGKTGAYLKKGSGVNYKVDGLKPSTKYRLTAKIKVEKAGDSVRLFAQSYNAQNASGSSAMATAPAWTEVTLEFQTGPNDSSCEVGAWKDAGLGDGGAFIDDFQLVQE